MEGRMQSIRKPGARDAYQKDLELHKKWAREGK